MPSYSVPRTSPWPSTYLVLTKQCGMEASRRWASIPVQRAPYTNTDKPWRAMTAFLRTQRHAAQSHEGLGTSGCTYLGRSLDMATERCRAFPRADVSQGEESTAPQVFPPGNPSSLGLCLRPCCLAASVCQKRAIAALLFQPTAQSCPTVKGRKQDCSAQGLSSGVTAQRLE